MNAFLLTALLLIAAPGENRVHAELVADVDAIAPGATFRLGVLFRIPERAHIYWRNPGGSGLATGVDWTMPGGVSAGPLQWPNPRRFNIDGLDEVNYGYEREVLLFCEVADDSGGEAITIAARAYWLLCLDDGQCIPEESKLTLTIPVDTAGRASETEQTFEDHAARVPKPLEEFKDRLQCSTIKPFLWVNFRPPLQAMPSWDGEETAFFPETGPPWSRVLPGPEVGSPKAAFHRDGPDPPDAGGMHALPKGVLTVPIGDPRTNEVRVEYIQFDE
jgi:DsbC/DsbD-like thiol-disulfide interchange protein